MGKILNLIGGPGVGKTKLAGLLAYELCVLGYNCEIVHEQVKTPSWEKNWALIGYQPKVFSDQAYQQHLICERTDIAISDSPLILSLVYNADKTSDEFKKFVLSEANSYQNINYFINRDLDREYQTTGRVHDLPESMALDAIILETLESYKIPFKRISNSRESVAVIINDITRS